MKSQFHSSMRSPTNITSLGCVLTKKITEVTENLHHRSIYLPGPITCSSSVESQWKADKLDTMDLDIYKIYLQHITQTSQHTSTSQRQSTTTAGTGRRRHRSHQIFYFFSSMATGQQQTYTTPTSINLMFACN